MLFHRDAFYNVLLDKIPLPILIVDEDVRIYDFNEYASEIILEGETRILRQRGGDVLKCLNAARSEHGCGTSPECKHCVIRNSVGDALNGKQVMRRRMALQVELQHKVMEYDFLVTASRLECEDQTCVLLILEDISELTRLRRIIPICAGCKKIRDDEDYWGQVEDYFEKHMEVNFSHGLCPECSEKIYPEYQEEEIPQTV